MNYFAHGYCYLDDPYFVAGTAVPDWLNVIDRKMKARSKSAIRFVNDDDSSLAALARGIVQHHDDDRWFHQTRAFAELSLQFTLQFRDALPGDAGFRPSFLGHIVVELLLDDVLIAENPRQLDAYYDALAQLEPAAVQNCVNRIATRPTDRLGALLPRFIAERFLCDYADDARLLMRLNHVMRRVKLPQLPPEVQNVFPAARRDVQLRKNELLQVRRQATDQRRLKTIQERS